MTNTGIKWTDLTWNPVSGCQKISQGCKFCYAKTVTERFPNGFKNGFDLDLKPHKLREPFKIKEPALIFVNSMSDLFWDQIPNDYRHKILDVIEQTPQHQYQVLTKRADAMLDFSKERKLPENFWAGVSVEDNKNLHRIELLQQVDAKIRFISYEPLLEDLNPHDLKGIHWAIIGGESGDHLLKPENANRALAEIINKRWQPRTDRIDWVRHLRDLCLEYNTALFFKQWGGQFPASAGNLLDGIKHENYPIF